MNIPAETGAVYTVKQHGSPYADGRYKITLAPNGREYIAHVNGPFIQLDYQRSPQYMSDMFADGDTWQLL